MMDKFCNVNRSREPCGAAQLLASLVPPNRLRQLEAEMDFYTQPALQEGLKAMPA